VRVVEVLEHDGMGLNLSVEVRDGILKHSKGKGEIVSDNSELSAVTLEGQIARIADIAAYVNHDLDDAIRGRILSEHDLPAEVGTVLGHAHGQRIGRLVTDAVTASRLEEKCQIRLSPEVLHALVTLRDVLFDRVYERADIRKEFERAERVVSELWAHFHLHADEFHARHWPRGVPDNEDLSRAVADFITGMTDRYALRTYEECFLPRPWTVV
jgi:dGTPase